MTETVNPHRKLTRETVEQEEELTALGLPMASIAAGLGVHRSTLRERITAGASPPASPLEASLLHRFIGAGQEVRGR
jgi:hypothetical protein